MFSLSLCLSPLLSLSPLSSLIFNTNFTLVIQIYVYVETYIGKLLTIILYYFYILSAIKRHDMHIW